MCTGEAETETIAVVEFRVFMLFCSSSVARRHELQAEEEKKEEGAMITTRNESHEHNSFISVSSQNW